MTNDLDITTGGYKRLNGGAPPSQPVFDSKFSQGELEANAIYNFFVLGNDKKSNEYPEEIQDALDQLIKKYKESTDEKKSNIAVLEASSGARERGVGTTVAELKEGVEIEDEMIDLVTKLKKFNKSANDINGEIKIHFDRENPEDVNFLERYLGRHESKKLKTHIQEFIQLRDILEFELETKSDKESYDEHLKKLETLIEGIHNKWQLEGKDGISGDRIGDRIGDGIDDGIKTIQERNAIAELGVGPGVGTKPVYVYNRDIKDKILYKLLNDFPKLIVKMVKGVLTNAISLTIRGLGVGISGMRGIGIIGVGGIGSLLLLTRGLAKGGKWAVSPGYLKWQQREYDREICEHLEPLDDFLKRKPHFYKEDHIRSDTGPFSIVYNKYLKDITECYKKYNEYMTVNLNLNLNKAEIKLAECIGKLIDLRKTIQRCQFGTLKGTRPGIQQMGRDYLTVEGGGSSVDYRMGGAPEPDFEQTKLSVLKHLDSILDNLRTTHEDSIKGILNKFIPIFNNLDIFEKGGVTDQSKLINNFNSLYANFDKLVKNYGIKKNGTDSGFIIKFNELSRNQIESSWYDVDRCMRYPLHVFKAKDKCTTALTNYLAELRGIMKEINVFNTMHKNFIDGKRKTIGDDTLLLKKNEILQKNDKLCPASIRDVTPSPSVDDDEQIKTIYNKIEKYCGYFTYDCLMKISGFHLYQLIELFLVLFNDSKNEKYVLSYSLFVDIFSNDSSVLSKLVDPDILDWIRESVINGSTEALKEECKKKLEGYDTSISKSLDEIKNQMDKKKSDFISCYVRNATQELEEINKGGNEINEDEIIEKLTTLVFKDYNDIFGRFVEKRISDSSRKKEKQITKLPLIGIDKLYGVVIMGPYHKERLRLYLTIVGLVKGRADVYTYKRDSGPANPIIMSDITQDIINEKDSIQISSTGDKIVIKKIGSNYKIESENSILNSLPDNVINSLMTEIIKYHKEKDICWTYNTLLEIFNEKLNQEDDEMYNSAESDFMGADQEYFKEGGFIGERKPHVAKYINDKITKTRELYMKYITTDEDEDEAEYTKRTYIVNFVEYIIEIIDTFTLDENHLALNKERNNFYIIHSNLRKIKKQTNSCEGLDTYEKFEKIVKFMYELRFTYYGIQKKIIDSLSTESPIVTLETDTFKNIQKTYEKNFIEYDATLKLKRNKEESEETTWRNKLKEYAYGELIYDIGDILKDFSEVSKYLEKDPVSGATIFNTGEHMPEGGRLYYIESLNKLSVLSAKISNLDDKLKTGSKYESLSKYIYEEIEGDKITFTMKVIQELTTYYKLIVESIRCSYNKEYIDKLTPTDINEDIKITIDTNITKYSDRETTDPTDPTDPRKTLENYIHDNLLLIQYQFEEIINSMQMNDINLEIKKIHEHLKNNCNNYHGLQFKNLFNGESIQDEYIECIAARGEFSKRSRVDVLVTDGQLKHIHKAFAQGKMLGVYYIELIKYREYYYYSTVLDYIIYQLNRCKTEINEKETETEKDNIRNTYCDTLISYVQFHEHIMEYISGEGYRRLNYLAERILRTEIQNYTKKNDSIAKVVINHFRIIYNLEAAAEQTKLDGKWHEENILSEELKKFRKDVIRQFIGTPLSRIGRDDGSDDGILHQSSKHTGLIGMLENLKNGVCDFSENDDGFKNFLRNMRLNKFCKKDGILVDDKYDTPEYKIYEIDKLNGDIPDEALVASCFNDIRDTIKHWLQIQITYSKDKKAAYKDLLVCSNNYNIINFGISDKYVVDMFKDECNTKLKQLKKAVTKGVKLIKKKEKEKLESQEHNLTLISSKNELEKLGDILDMYMKLIKNLKTINDMETYDIYELNNKIQQQVDEVNGIDYTIDYTIQLDEIKIDVLDNLLSKIYSRVLFNQFYYYDKISGIFEDEGICKVSESESKMRKFLGNFQSSFQKIGEYFKNIINRDKKDNEKKKIESRTDFDPTIPEYVKLLGEINKMNEEIEETEKVLPKIDYGDESEEKKVEEEVVEKEKEKETEDLEKPMDEEKRKPPISEKIDDIDEIKPVEEIEKPKQPRSYSPQRRSRKYYPESTIHKIDKPKKYEVKSKIEFTDKTVMRDREDDGDEDDEDLEDLEDDEDLEDPFKIDDKLDARLRLEEKIYLEKAKERNMKLKILLNEKLKQEMKKKEKELVTMNQYLSYSNLTFEEVKDKFELPNYETRQQVFLISDYFKGYTKEIINKEYVLGFLKKLDKEISYEEKQILIKISNYYNKTYPEKMLKHDLSQHTTSFNGVYSVLHTLIRVHKDLPKILCKTLR